MSETLRFTAESRDMMTLATSAVYLLAAQLDGIEDLRKATENRFRQATRSVADSDGEIRGLGLKPDGREVAAVITTAHALVDIEKQAILALQRAMRSHPLGPWQKAQIGVGEKQLGRLLAAIGDPYWNSLHDRPRTVSELWAYAGLHTVPTNPPSGTPDQGTHDAQRRATRGAARRKKGVKSNWSTDAKTRAYLIAESCVKQTRSPYRKVYDLRREATEARTHDRPCPQCNGAGKTELLLTPWRAGHQHADALRIVSKTVLRDLWIAARDWHAG